MVVKKKQKKPNANIHGSVHNEPHELCFQRTDIKTGFQLVAPCCLQMPHVTAALRLPSVKYAPSGLTRHSRPHTRDSTLGVKAKGKMLTAKCFTVKAECYVLQAKR